MRQVLHGAAEPHEHERQLQELPLHPGGRHQALQAAERGGPGAGRAAAARGLQRLHRRALLLPARQGPALPERGLCRQATQRPCQFREVLATGQAGHRVHRLEAGCLPVPQELRRYHVPADQPAALGR
ncbi:hypothetical protein FOCC_FOCC008680, partial [Frankliniella occidentalis]